MRKSKAFTLIELLVVIAIIALLLAVLFPALRMAKEHAKRLLCGKDLSTIGLAIAMYAEQQDDAVPTAAYRHPVLRPTGVSAVSTYFFGQYPAALATATSDERLEALLGDNPAATRKEYRARVTNLGHLMRADLIDKSIPKIFYCDSNKESAFTYYGSGGDDDWPKGLVGGGSGAVESLRISYSYLPQSRYKKHPVAVVNDYPDVAFKYSKMDPSCSVVMDLLKGGWMAHRSSSYVGVNILYGDGSVIFKRDEDNVIKDSGNLINNGNAERFRFVIKALE